jgi:hypothetical protein
MPAEVAQRPGTVTETVIQRTVKNKSEPKERGDFWDYQANLTPEQWKEHDIYIYRYRTDSDGRSKRGPYVDKFVSPISLAMIKGLMGGGRFNALMHDGRELVFNEDFEIEGAPKVYNPDGSAIFAPPAAAGTDGSANALGMKALEMSLNQPAIVTAMMSLLAEAAKQSIELVKAQQQPAQNPLETLRAAKEILTPVFAGAAPSSANPIMDKLVDAMIARMLNPTDPIETFAKMVTAVKSFGLIGGDRVNIGTELVRQLPTVAEQVKGAVHEWRMGMEAQAGAVAMSRGAVPVGGGPATPPVQQPAMTTGGPATPAAAASGPQPVAEVVPVPPIEWVEQKIVEILSEPEANAEQCAEETFDWLIRTSPGLVLQLFQAGEAGILGLFSKRPILQQVQNSPRLVPFVKKFMTLCVEEKIEEQLPKPN